jgi:hypothetical protein
MTETEKVLANLRAHVKSSDGEWVKVYLDNARPSRMTPGSYACHLSALIRAGLYRPLDGFAWGLVRMADAR